MSIGVYDSKLGRFLEIDPVEGGSVNAYVNGDPVNTYDLGGTLADSCSGPKTSMSKCLADKKKHAEEGKNAKGLLAR